MVTSNPLFLVYLLPSCDFYGTDCKTRLPAKKVLAVGQSGGVACRYSGITAACMTPGLVFKAGNIKTGLELLKMLSKV